MSELLRQACSEARKGNQNIKQQVRDIGSKFLNNVEINAQEAVYIVLQLPMRKASRKIIFISTSPPNERVELSKEIMILMKWMMTVRKSTLVVCLIDIVNVQQS